MIAKGEGAIDVATMDATRIHRLVNAFAEWPRCSLVAENLPPLADVSMKLLRTRLVDASVAPLPAKGAVVWYDGGVFLRCAGDSVLELLEVQPATKRVMDARSWWNGQKHW